jgi:putative transposase
MAKSQMNEIRQKHYEMEMERPKKVDKKGKEMEPKLKLFNIPNKDQSFIGYSFVEALFKVMKQVDYTSMPAQTNQQTLKKVFGDC